MESNNLYPEINSGITDTETITSYTKSAGFKIPDYQRSYVWSFKELHMLWEDITEVYKNLKDKNSSDRAPQHFMGFVTLKKISENPVTYNVLDGQQRLSTFSILLDCLQAFLHIDTPKRKRIVLDSSNIATEVQNDFSKKTAVNNSRKEVYRFFISEIRSFRDENDEGDDFFAEILDIVLTRFFWCINISEGEEHSVFEGLNATGKNIEFTDFLLNYILEKNTEDIALKRSSLSNEDLKARWNNVLNAVSESRIIPEEVLNMWNKDNDETEEAKIKAKAGSDTGVLKALKAKKFLNALNSVTLPEPCSVEESVGAFGEIFVRLYNSYNCKKNIITEKELTASFIIEEMESWSQIYNYISDPVNNKPKYFENHKELEEEVYMLGLIATSKTLPMMMRTLYGFKNNKYSSQFAKVVFMTVCRIMLYIEIYHLRISTEKVQVLKRITFADRVADGFLKHDMTEKETGTAPLLLLSFLAGNSFTSEILKTFKKIETSDSTLESYIYNSSYSKAVLAIDHNCHQKSSLLEIERGLAASGTRSSFEVEHMIPQSSCCSENYGASVTDINTFKNLILLEGSLNASAGNNPPEEKVSCWKGSELSLYYQDYASGYKFESKKADFTASQAPRMKELTEAFYLFMQQLYSLVKTDPKSSMGIFPPWFMYVKKENGRVIFTKNYDESFKFHIESQKQGCYLLCGEEYKESASFPKPDRNNNLYSIIFEPAGEGENKSIVNLYHQIVPPAKIDKDNLIALHSREKDEIKTDISNLNIVHGFINLWAKEKGVTSIIEFLNSVEKDSGGGYREAFSKDKKVWLRLIHTSDYRAWALSQKSGESALLSTGYHAENTYFYDSSDITALPKKGQPACDSIEINTSYSFRAICSALKNIFTEADLYFTGKGESKLSFAYFAEFDTPSNEFFLDNSEGVIMIPYVNMGNDEAFEEFVLEKLRLKAPGEALTAFENKLNSSITPYFAADKKSFADIISQYREFNIPLYQRKYVWDKNNWQELYDELMSNSDPELGSIIISENNGKYDLVDGQQRMTTLYMFLSSVNSESKNNIALSPFPYEEIKESCNDFLKDKKEGLKEKLLKCKFTILKIVNAPALYQYQVFTAVNGKGKKLTTEEKFKNFLLLKKVSPSAVKSKCSTEGFLKVFAEIKEREHIPEEALYKTLKDIFQSECSDEKKKISRFMADMEEYLHCFKVLTKVSLKGKDSKYSDKKWLWLRLYMLLSNVHTADSLLTEVLYKAEKNEYTENVAAEIFKKTDLILFLLYIMDRNGNDKKSVNAKLPAFCENPSSISITKPAPNEKYIFSEAERQIFSDKNALDIIWNDYLLTSEIATFDKRTARFILYIMEYYMGLNEETLDSIIKKDLENEEFIELEHIWPLSKEHEFEDVRPLHLNCLENICLLEKSINASLGNNFLYEKNSKENFTSSGKLIRISKGKTEYPYKMSKFIMPQKIHEMQKNNIAKVSIYGKESGLFSMDFAESRLKNIKELAFEKFSEDIKNLTV